MFREFAYFCPQTDKLTTCWINVNSIELVIEYENETIFDSITGSYVEYPCTVVCTSGGSKLYLNGTLSEILQRLPQA